MFTRDLFEASHHALRLHVGAFLDEEVVPHHQSWAQAEQVPPEIWLKAGGQGLLCRTVPPEYGGLGHDFRDSVIVIEELATRRLSGLLTFLQSDIVAPIMLRLGSEEQKQRYLPAFCSGQMLGAMALTEPHSGSDIYAMQTTADPLGPGFVINGTKSHISHGSIADVIIVVARSKRYNIAGRNGFTLLLVDRSSPGLSCSNISKTGMKALITSWLEFQDCQVSANSLLGSEGMGIVHLMPFLSMERLVLSIYAQASAEALLSSLVDACQQRKTSIGTLLDYQHTKFRLADLLSECATNRAFVDQCISRHLKNQLDLQAPCIAKLRTTELLKSIGLLNLHLRGASGISGTTGAQVAQDLIESAAQSIWGGTSEVMRDIIGSSITNVL